MQVVEELLSMAGAGEAHEHTLLMVFGDHGQTLTGDHGGGAPEEVDSALLALNMGAYHQIRSASEFKSSMYAPMDAKMGTAGRLVPGREHRVSDRLSFILVPSEVVVCHSNDVQPAEGDDCACSMSGLTKYRFAGISRKSAPHQNLTLMTKQSACLTAACPR